MDRFVTHVRWLGVALLLFCAQPGWAETTTYMVTDAQGTVVAQVDRAGHVTYEAAYRPYGRQAVGIPQAGPGYAGHVNDPDTGLVYMQQRYYDPEVGQFLSVDPVGPLSGHMFNFNRYAYANNNPIVNIDPDGRYPGAKENPCPNVECKRSRQQQQQNKMTRAFGGLVFSRSEAVHRANKGGAYLNAHAGDVQGSYFSPKAAASMFGQVFADKSSELGLEFGANIIKVFALGKVMYELEDLRSTTMIQVLGPSRYSLGNVTIPGRAMAVTYWGWVHTHPVMDGGFSYYDVEVSLARHVNAYVLFPNQTVMSFDYSKYHGQGAYYVWRHQSEFQF